MQTSSPLIRITGILGGLLAIAISVILVGSIEVAAGASTCVTQIDPNISVSPNNLPFGVVFPEEVIIKPVKIALSSSCLLSKKIKSVSYTIVQTSKGKKSSDDDYCAAHPSDLVKCYPSLCPYLSKTPDGTPANDTGVAAFHDPQATSSISHGLLLASGDTEDTWKIDLHVPCFKGECAQDGIVPAAYELDPKLIGSQFGCNLNVNVGTTTDSPPPPPPFKEHEGTIGFWKNWDKSNTYTQAQISGWITTINASSSWLMTEGGYPATVAGMVSLINDSSGCNGAQRACQKKKFLAQYLATRLDIESGRKILSGTYTMNLLVTNYFGVSNPVSLATALAKTEGKLPDNGVNPTLSQFSLMAGAFDGINNTGI